MTQASIMIMAGGTGGHVFPGLAVARELIARGFSVCWLGTQRGVEASAVPASGLSIDIEWLTVRGVRGKGILSWLMFPFTLARAMLGAYRILRRRKPKLVLSFGGFVAGPGGLVAWLTRTPLIIHEANAIPGLTNRWLALFARRILTGFTNGFRQAQRVQQVGNPVRREIAQLPEPQTRLAGRSGALRVLVVGGSLGARVFNEIVPSAIRQIGSVDVRHQSGRNQADATRTAYENYGSTQVMEFIDDMAEAYNWADVVIARAGAMTVAELSAAGCCAVLVPYPHAVDDHQTANARYLSLRDAAVLLPQPEFTVERLSQILRLLSGDRERILKMATAARALAMPYAAMAVADVCQEVRHA